MGLFPFWENFTASIIDYGMSTYSNIEPWVYPFIFLGIIGFIYAGVKSLTAAIVGIIIIFATFVGTGIFEETYETNLFFYIIAIVGIAMLILAALLLGRDR